MSRPLAAGEIWSDDITAKPEEPIAWIWHRAIQADGGSDARLLEFYRLSARPPLLNGSRTMSEEDGFLGSIKAAPADKTPRLVSADWLEEREDPRGEFLRVECILVDPQQENSTIRSSGRGMLHFGYPPTRSGCARLTDSRREYCQPAPGKSIVARRATGVRG